MAQWYKSGTLNVEAGAFFKHSVPANTLHRMKDGKSITTITLDTLCSILNCSVSDIFRIYSTRKI